MLEAATTLWSLTEVEALLPLAGRRATKGMATPVPKVTHLPALLSTPYRTLPMACASFTIITPIEHSGVLHPVLSWKTKVPLNLFWFSGHSSSCHCHCNAFPSQCWTELIFLTDELTNDRFFVDTGATLSIIPCTSNSDPLLKGADGQPIPTWGFIQRTVPFQGELSLLAFCKPLWQVPYWALTF
jgi:hypothetical protein